MRDRLLRVGLAALAVVSAGVGTWALLAPRSFYDDFPGAGRAWVSGDGPFNEHLARDVGAFNLAFAVLLAWAAVSLTRALVVGSLTAYLVYAVPHFVYHVAHLDTLPGTTDKVAQTATLALSVAVPGLLLVLVRPRPRFVGDSPLT